MTLSDYFYTVIAIAIIVHYEMMRQDRAKLRLMVNRYRKRWVGRFLKSHPEYHQVGYFHAPEYRIERVMLYENKDGEKCLMEVGTNDSKMFYRHLCERMDSGEFRLIKDMSFSDYELPEL
jgi:hypothetical protein